MEGYSELSIKTKNNTEENKKTNPKSPKDTKKEDILSKLDRLDDISIAKSRKTEEKFRKSLIKSELTIKKSVNFKNHINISDIKKEIEELRCLKQEYIEKGEIDKLIEITRKIIEKAKESDLKLILNEENKFLLSVLDKNAPIKLITEQIEELKKKRHSYYNQEKFDEAIQIAKLIIDLAKEENLIQLIKVEENFINLMEEKITEKRIQNNSENLVKDLEQLKTIKLNNDSLREKFITEVKKKIPVEFDKLEEVKRELKDAKEQLEQEKAKFIEEKESFNFEKQMFEEVMKNKRQEIEQNKLLEKTIKEPNLSKMEEFNRLEQEKLKLEAEREKLNQEKIIFEKEIRNFEQEKLKLKEEKEAFEWEKKMFEELKKHELDKKTS
ncbi:MAG: hypothetical protein ACFE9Z_03625 [Promethearchaeota archaeon]